MPICHCVDPYSLINALPLFFAKIVAEMTEKSQQISASKLITNLHDNPESKFDG